MSRIYGLVLSVEKGRAGRGFIIVPSVVNTWVEERPSGLAIEAEAEREGVSVAVRVEAGAPYQPAWIAVVGLEGRDWSGSAYVCVLPKFERVGVVRRARGDDKSYAVGAASAEKVGGGYYLGYRWRNGDRLRGKLLEISRSGNGVDGWEVVAEFDKHDYGYLSFEKPCFVKGAEYFMYCADVGGTWRIFLVEAGRPEDLELPGRPVVDGGKDPAAIWDGDRCVLAYSDLRNRGHDLTVVETGDFEEVRVLAASIFYSQLIPQGNAWARTHMHAGAILKAGGYYLLLYDALPREPQSFGSGWLGVAVSRNLREWVDLTLEEPLMRGGGVDQTFRYVDAVVEGDCYLLYAEEEAETGRKDLVVYHGR